MTPSTLFARVVRRLTLTCHAPSLRRWVSNHLRHICTDQELPVWTSHGFNIAVSPRDYVSHRVFFFGEYDPEMSGVIRHLLRAGDVAWDIGAERGWFSLLMGTVVGSRGQVSAFEASPETVAKLTCNLGLNKMPWISIVPLAVTDTVGSTWFVPPAGVAAADTAALVRNGGIGYVTQQRTATALPIKTTTLDEYAEGTGTTALAFIKLDVEGQEVNALRGGIRTISRFRPIIAVEYNQITAIRAESSVQELDDLLESWNYDRMVFRNSFQPLLSPDIPQSPEDPAVFNVYCFPRERQYR